jgi:serine/threonine-protein kinase
VAAGPAPLAPHPPASAQPQPATSPKPSKGKARSGTPFSTREWISHSLFTGVQGTLIWNFGQSLGQLFGIEAAVPGLWLLIILVALQQSRTIERWDLLLLPVITIGVVSLIPLLRNGLALLELIMLAGAIGLVCVIVTCIIRLGFLLTGRSRP